MVETGRVLERSYRLTGQEVAVALEGLLRMEALVIENAQEAFAAVVMLKEGRGSFADALIGALGVKAGCIHTATFDKGALRLPGFAPG
jgi:predicted nucleic-acid-binding protein